MIEEGRTFPEFTELVRLSICESIPSIGTSTFGFELPSRYRRTPPWTSTRITRTVSSYTPEVRDRLLTHSWIGNLRELNNGIKRSVLLSTSETMGMEQMPIEILAGHTQRPNAQQGDASTPAGDDLRAISHQAEKQAILSALERNSLKKAKTAEMLDIDRKALCNKLKTFGIER